ncbi:DUF1816 domain-containing protein [Prochlorococcus marinus]|uniref:DUF1816 domain-containing protein n=1 Tax=Prochlorococcus marinus TaxID=1219 RepID=UPI0022B54D93|nr:DUF1816 domain-containing protein [Prochlorococcus marinus]
MGPIRALRSLGNSFGLAWWAKVETIQPEVTYWFGPFLTRRSLKVRLNAFIEDLSAESPKKINHSLIRCRRNEPLTS